MLGNHKSGTTAIARLLAELTGISATLDLRGEFRAPCFEAIKQGALPFEALLERNKLDFSRDLIKSPDLTAFFDELRIAFPEAKFAFIVRDPRDNIRSILDRLKLPGNQARLTPAQWRSISPAWRLVVDGSWLGLRAESYVEMLAARWNLCADVFLKHPEALVSCRYEDFERDKLWELRRLAHALGLRPMRDVSDRLDVPYQPRGANRDVAWRDFFGPNLDRIEALCGARMTALGYGLEARAA